VQTNVYRIALTHSESKQGVRFPDFQGMVSMASSATSTITIIIVQLMIDDLSNAISTSCTRLV
jgi:hypothetical protein